LLTYLFIKNGSRLGIIDIPNQRSLHDTPKPRTGGLAVLIAMFVGFFLFREEVNSELLPLTFYSLIILVVAFIDDIYSISAFVRLPLQFLLASVFIWNGLNLDILRLPGLDIPLNYFVGSGFTAIFIVWVINLYNFMDGMDGFASGMAIIGFSTFAALSTMQGDISFAIFNLVIVAAAVGFIVFNLPPAKIFLGDVGSTLFGVLVALTILWAEIEQIFPLWLGIITFMPFFLDASITLGKRMLKREKFWRAHRTHYYQRLVLSGFGHKKTLILEYTWMLVCSLFSVFFFINKNMLVQFIVLIFFVAICIVILVYIDSKTKIQRTDLVE